MSLNPRLFPFGDAGAQAAALRAGRIGSVELLRAYLDRVDRFNPGLNAIVADDRAAALKRARAADRARARGEVWGPLHGLPMTVKESFDLAGQPTTWGHPARRDHRAETDALAVQRLKAAGAVIFGKTNVPLNLADFQSYNEVYGTTNNPWDTTRAPGGSSGGSAAAVAAGLCALEFGSDIGGSIRNPAAYCGVYGHKPTWCIVPKRGHSLVASPGAEMDLSVIGPIARSAADLDLALKVTVGPDALTARGVAYRLPAPPKALKGLRIAVWLDEATAPVDAAVKARVEAAARALGKAGAKLDFRARPAFDPAHAHRVYNLLLQANMAARRPDYDRLVAERARLGDDDHTLHAQALRASTASYRDVFVAQQQREQLRWAWHDFFGRHDLLLTPITATPAFPHDPSEPMPARTMRVDGAEVSYFAQLFWAGLATASFLPATIAPGGLSPEGLPVGVQIVGPEMADRRTIWLAGQLARLIGGFVPPPGY
ncbi:MAG: amidase [Burkholderiales bacterium]|nr:amidase [Burkholderiales bacterium]